MLSAISRRYKKLQNREKGQSDSDMQQLLLLAVVLVVGCIADEVKNATAEGNYYPNQCSEPPCQNYVPPPPPPPPPSYNSYVGYQYIRPPPPPLIDREVCDLDASVLLVVPSKRHRDRDRLNRAHRVRCSVIASYDEDSCNICCQHAARRDKNLENKQFVGFLALSDDFETHDRRRERERSSEEHHDDDDRDHRRYKRHVERDEEHPDIDEPIRVHETEYQHPPAYTNMKCVCCAPKRPLPPPPPPPPIHGQPHQIYQTPVYSQPNYAPPV
ncbi:unnamed protein product [Cylicocyclus nassatus]|uniref:Uncharacterized protein n=1 Tax=Cylicocyclus nassatus TaxID=53992 RepID=A0AA36GZ69_CYLNA|nr:unnamed protein product [Cylicocyclus nassatus]